MKVLLASSEVHPYSKSGGLADMVGALAKFVGRAGHEVSVVTPLYRDIAPRFSTLQESPYQLDLPLGQGRLTARVRAAEMSRGVMVYFIDAPELYDRASLYGENGSSYADNARRFLFFAKCVPQIARQLPCQPDLIHLHDWQSSLVPLLIRHEKNRGAWPQPPRTVLTIHNLAYQGVFPRDDYALLNLPWDYFSPDGVEFYQHLNCLKAGIRYADFITTVSPTYAHEITSLEFGCGLEGVLRGRADALAGILNGVDYDEWNTTENPYLAHAFSMSDLAGKQALKVELQRELKLPERAEAPLFACITRLTEQKGIGVLLGALEEMLASEMQFVLLGSGDPPLEAACQDLAARHPDKVAVRLGFDQALSHRIEAGADFFLMPSRFEPCGLNQMYSQRYATIPIVRSTGGLADTVIDLTESQDTATGIKFTEFSSRALAKGIRKALVLFGEKELLSHLRRNAMAADFSWKETAQKYLEVYRRVGEGR